MSRCCSEGQQAANASMSESQTVRLAVRKSLRRRGRPRARCWKHPVLLWSVGHQPRSNSSSILMRGDKFTGALLWCFTAKRLKSTKNPTCSRWWAQPDLDQSGFCSATGPARWGSWSEQPTCWPQHRSLQSAREEQLFEHILKQLLKTSEFLCKTVNTFDQILEMLKW